VSSCRHRKTHTHTHAHTHTYTHTHTHRQTRTHTITHTHTYKHTHTHTQAHVHTRAPLQSTHVHIHALTPQPCSLWQRTDSNSNCMLSVLGSKQQCPGESLLQYAALEKYGTTPTLKRSRPPGFPQVFPTYALSASSGVGRPCTKFCCSGYVCVDFFVSVTVVVVC